MEFDVLRFLRLFQLRREKEEYSVVREVIERESVFSGANIWILFFAILVASLGLNINSTAVVIGAMLISPLMGPIVGIGFGVAIRDLKMMKNAFVNYAFAAAVGLSASTIYFALSPIDEAHSEILSRTLPNIYDVLIALFGGFAGIIAISSKYKGNVIPGVAIATALMPPLCTAGYGLATFQFNYFLGAFYLYLINSVFIAAATLFTATVLKFPKKEYEDSAVEKKEKIIIWSIITLTLLPSIYLGYDIVKKSRFQENAKKFIKQEANFENDYLLNQEVDPKERKIVLTYGGKEIDSLQIKKLREKLEFYDLKGTQLEIKQGFSILEVNKEDEKVNQMGFALNSAKNENEKLRQKLDSIQHQQLDSKKIYNELKVQFPIINEAVVQKVYFYSETTPRIRYSYLVLLTVSEEINFDDQRKLNNWLKVRLDDPDLHLIINYKPKILP